MYHLQNSHRQHRAAVWFAVSRGFYRAYNTIKDNNLAEILVIHHRGLATYLKSVGLLPCTFVYLGPP